MSCDKTNEAYKSFMNGLIGTRKGTERDAYMGGHKDANQYLLNFIDALPEDEQKYYDKLKEGAQYVVDCINRIQENTIDNTIEKSEDYLLKV